MNVIFPEILGKIIPIDDLIFFRGFKPPVRVLIPY